MVSRKSRIESAKYLLALLLAVSVPISALMVSAQYPTEPQIRKDGTTVLIEDYADLPISNPTHAGSSAEIDFKLQLGRVNSLRSEPANAPMAASRYFVIDESAILYILDKSTRKFSPYLNFKEIFPKFDSDTGTTAGLISLAFDPDYAKNGKFYTVHIEMPSLPGATAPTNAGFPSLDLTGYTVMPTVKPPAGETHYESIVNEWTDTNIRNATFEGSSRELLRVAFDRSHPMDDLLFDPLAKPGSADYGNLYISHGDGASGETPGPQHFFPQQLNNFMGKILRITPDIHLRPQDRLSSNGQYRIPSTGPDPNPFVSIPGALGEIFAYGLRHPHRMTWDPVSNVLLATDIGDHYWEAVVIVTKGANYGYAEREGNEQFFVDNAGKTTSLMDTPPPFPEKDLLHVDGIDEPVALVYPAALYSHKEGDSIGSGFVYRGKSMPQLRGKFIFNDITTGRIFYADLNELIATRGQRNHQAQIHEIQIMYKNPYDTSIQAPVKTRMYDVVAAGYKRKGGAPFPHHVLPGGGAATTGYRDLARTLLKTDYEGVVWGGGRADVRVVADGDGELYVLSKSDGMIRKFAAVVTPPPASK